jgi:hypothetical protein
VFRERLENQIHIYGCGWELIKTCIMTSLSTAHLISVYSFLIGIFMLGFWLMLLLTDQVPSDQKPYAISFHLAGEFLTATILIISGVGIWLKKPWAKTVSVLALGMLLIPL